MMSEAIRAAVEVINGLKDKGFDYSMHKAAIAEAFDEGLLEGNNEANVECPGKKSLRIIQEDHYDQHMDEDEDKPEWDDILVYVVTVPAYVWME